MSKEKVEDQLVDLERQYWNALKNGDAETAMRLSDDPCIVTGAQGVGSLDRRTLGDMMKSARYKLDGFQIDGDVKVKLLTDDVAVVAYKVREELTVEGKPIVLDAADSSTWVRRDGRWVCALHSEAPAGDAFGRDRTTTGAPGH